MPSGVVTLLFTDIQDSTRTLARVGDEAFEALLDTHHRVVREAVADHGGVEVSTEGDGFFVAFEAADRAVACAVAIQRGLSGGDIRVRAGLHTGPVRLGSDNYVGLNVHLAARISSAAHGGQVLVSEPTAIAAGDVSGMEFQPLGRHRLKDLSSPVEVLQVLHADLAVDFPPPRSLSRVTNNLPVLASSFVGRDAETVALTKLLGKERLVTILGVGGVGKTRLALQIAADIGCEEDQEVWLVDLSLVSNPVSVPEALSRALELPSSVVIDPMDAVLDALTVRHALVLLDSCEHVVDAAAAAASAILAACPSVRLIATSRVPLDVSGEAVLLLGPLGRPSRSETRDTWHASEAVQLFGDRAESASGLHIGEHTGGAVQRICDLVEGIPLAIELAAARTRSMSLLDLARGLEGSIALLSKGRRDAAPRHRSLDAALTWSFDLLSEEHQRLLLRLSVAESPVSEAIAAALLQGLLARADVVDGLDTLVDASLLIALNDVPSGSRYRMLVPIRTFARERLAETGDLGAAEEAHAEYFAALAVERSSDGRSGRAAIDSQLADILKAAHYLISVGDAGPARIAQLLGVVRRPLLDRGWGREALRLLEQLLTRADIAFADRHGSFVALALTHERLGQLAEASAVAEQARQLAASGTDQGAAAESDYVDGLLAGRHGDATAARAHLHAALDAATRLGNRELLCRCLNQLSRLDAEAGDIAAALPRALEVVSMAEFDNLDIDDQFVSLVMRSAADPQARAAIDAALERARAAGDLGFELAHRLAVALAEMQAGNTNEADEALTSVERGAVDLGFVYLRHVALYGLAGVAAASGRHDDAIALLTAALEVAVEAGDLAHQVSYLFNLTKLHAARGDFNAAAKHARAQTVAARAVGDQIGVGLSLGNAGALFARLGRIDEARRLLEGALAQAESLDERSNPSYVLAGPLFWLGVLSEQDGDLRSAANYFARASSMADKIGDGDAKTRADEHYAAVTGNLLTASDA